MLLLVLTGMTLWSSQASAATVCSNDYPVAGYVVTRVTSSSSCPTNLRYTIVQPSTSGSTTYACSQSVIPAGFIVTSISTSTSCTSGLSSSLRYAIRVPTGSGTYYACQAGGAPIPVGWVVTSVSSSTSCANTGSGLRYAIRVPRSVTRLPRHVTNRFINRTR